MATKTALKLADYVVTEAGFGADLGAEKFLDIKSRAANIKPDAVVIVATIRALKMHGGVPKTELQKENLDALKLGLENLQKHIETIQQYGLPIVVAINRFTTDTKDEIAVLTEWCQQRSVPVALTEVWGKGGKGGIELGQLVLQEIEKNNKTFEYLY